LAVAVCGGELGADLIGLGGAETSVKGKSFLPMVAGLAVIAGGVVGAGEAVVGHHLRELPT